MPSSCPPSSFCRSTGACARSRDPFANSRSNLSSSCRPQPQPQRASDGRRLPTPSAPARAVGQSCLARVGHHIVRHSKISRPKKRWIFPALALERPPERGWAGRSCAAAWRERGMPRKSRSGLNIKGDLALIGRRTERLKTRCAINARVGFRLLAVPRDILRKCGDLRHEK
jgi:hypothetical protein